MRREKMTCHYFNAQTGDFLFTRERIPEDEDYCDNCGQGLTEDVPCSAGTLHYWVEYVDNRYMGR